MGECEAEGLEACHFGVEIVAFEVEHDVVGGDSFVVDIDRQSRFAVSTLKPGISRQGIDNEPEPELLKKLDRLDRQFAVDGDLVEVHFGKWGSRELGSWGVRRRKITISSTPLLPHSSLLQHCERFLRVVLELALGVFFDDR